MDLRRGKLYRLDIEGYSDWYRRQVGDAPVSVAPFVKVRTGELVWVDRWGCYFATCELVDDSVYEPFQGPMIPIEFISEYMEVGTDE